MRKSLLFISLSVVLLFCSCAQKSKLKPISDSFAFTAIAKWDNTEFEIDTAVYSEETVFTIKSPEKIRNLKLAFSGDSVNLYYLGLEKSFNISQIEPSSPVRIIYEGLSCAKDENSEITKKETEYFLKYSVANNQYLLYFSETGLPIKITDKSEKHTIELMGAAILTASF